MIEVREINKLAAKSRVNDRQIEKDYVLSWVLFAISKNDVLRNALLFKGGTVLKKAYFEDYRFSEDLDFTLIEESLSNEQIRKEFDRLFDFIKEESNMDMRIDDNNWAILESGSLQFYIDYVASLQGAMGSRSLKIDITRGEILETAIECRVIFNPYPDILENFQLQCYSLAEVLIEKMTALIGRTEPRDFYDLWYLTQFHDMDITDYQAEFEAKALHKGVHPDHLENRIERLLPVFRARWEKSLGSQITDLPPFEQVSRELNRHFRKVFRNK